MAAPAEQKKSYHVSKAFKAMNTHANRTAIEDDEFSWLENVQPIGAGNLKVVPTSLTAKNNSNASVVLTSNIVTMYSEELLGNTYIAMFTDSGASSFYDVNFGQVIAVAANSTFSTSGVTAAQFSNTDIIIGDPSKGLFVYDGNVTVQLGSGGAIGMLNVGAGYTAPPAVVISAPDQAGGKQAAATAVLTGNVVSEIVWTEPGTGYTKPPTVTISGGGGSNAQAVASLVSFKTGQVYYEVLNGGQGATYAYVTVTGGGGDGTANATGIISNGVMVNIIPTTLGNNYTNTANLVVTIHSDGANACVAAFAESNVVTDVATYAGRVWVSQGRELIYSGATNFNDFVGISAGSFYVTDSTLHGNILSLLAANNFLYFFGDDSVNVVSDVLVNSSGNTNLTNTNVGSSIGTKRPNSIFPYYRYVMFQNDYGVYGLIGSTTVKLSDPLDGIYQYIDFTKPVSGGQVTINNIICACFNFFCNNLVIGGSRWVQAVFFDKKWFMTSQGVINLICYSPVGGQLGLFGASGNALYRLYTDTANAISTTVQTALWELTDPIRDKQATKFAIEATFGSGAGVINVTLDNPQASSSPYTFQTYIGWTNYLNNTIGWTNNSSAAVLWTGGLGGYQLYRSDAQLPASSGAGQKYIGMTITSNSPAFSYNTFEMEYELRARF